MLTNLKTRITPLLSVFNYWFAVRLVFYGVTVVAVWLLDYRLQSERELNQLLTQKTELQHKLLLVKDHIISKQDTLIANQQETINLYRKFL